MGVRKRILTIRLMEKVNADPAAAEKLGIVVIKALHPLERENNGDRSDND